MEISFRVCVLVRRLCSGDDRRRQGFGVNELWAQRNAERTWPGEKAAGAN
jgi:hypothetical protein